MDAAELRATREREAIEVETLEVHHRRDEDDAEEEDERRSALSGNSGRVYDWVESSTAQGDLSPAGVTA